MKPSRLLITLFLTSAIFACNGEDTDSAANVETGINSSGDTAAITAVTFTGEPGSYTFSVTVESPDTGCNQYADWWEVLNADGDLLYRRILAHSHVDEQPFTRSGGPVSATAEEELIVRAHMNSAGYGELVFTGSVAQGFMQETLGSSFAEGLEFVDPLPDSCAF